MRPAREWSAIATGISAGLRSLFRRRPKVEEETIIIVDPNIPKTPAA
jgi:hypothetical protein